MSESVSLNGLRPLSAKGKALECGGVNYDGDDILNPTDALPTATTAATALGSTAAAASAEEARRSRPLSRDRNASHSTDSASTRSSIIQMRTLDRACSNTDMNNVPTKGRVGSNSRVSSTDRRKGLQAIRTHKPYAYTAPKILLETISAGGVLIVLVLTYVTFIGTFSWDATMTIFENSKSRALTAFPCSVNTNDQIYSGVTLGCTSSQSATSSMWLGHVTNLENIIAVSIDLEINNVTKAQFDSVWAQKRVLYSVLLSACPVSSECDNWEHVLKILDDSESVKNYYISNEERILIPLVGNMYQNQETIPTRGYIESYLMSINYTFYESDPSSPASFTDLSVSNSETLFYLDTLSRKAVPTTDALTVILLFLTVVVLGIYSYYMVDLFKSGKSLLPEQKWIFIYLVALILYQNPVYCVICWQRHPYTSAVFGSYILDALSQAVFFVLWLMFADAKYREQRGWSFYLPKISFGVLIFVSNILIYIYQFPSMSRYVNRERLLAVYNWSYTTKQALLGFSVIYLASILIWFIWWFVELYQTGSYLRKIRYMDSRFLQLSFRFFFLQATLVAMFYLLQDVAILYFIIKNSRDDWTTDITATADNINTLFRQQTQMFGKVLFLTMYGILLSFFFLPAGSMQFSAHAIVESTFVLNESEVPEMRRSRRRAIRGLRALGTLSSAKVDVYCVDTAIELAGLSYEAYRDPPGTPPTRSGFGTMNLARHGYALVDMKYNADFDTVVFMCRNIETNRMVVMFRGTASLKNWNSNLKYAKKAVDFYNMKMVALDVIDGLELKEKHSLLTSVTDGDDDGNGSDSSSDASDGDDPKAASLFRWMSAEDVNISARLRTGAMGISSRTMSFISRMRPTPEVAGDTAENAEKKKPNIFKIQRLMPWHTQMDQSEHGERQVSQNTGPESMSSAASMSSYRVPSQTASEAEARGSTGGLKAMVKKAASNTPVLRRAFNTYVHMGFWEAYLSVREFVHAVLRRELSVTPGEVYFTGHSLGGALATLAAIDFVINSQPRINYYLHAKYWSKQALNMPGENREAQKFKPIKTSMYNIGSPRVGNRVFAALFNEKIPNAFRTIVDGDVVTAVPPKSSGYKHIGTRVDIDGEGSGNLIIDASFVERRFKTSNKNSVSAHMLSSYCLALQAVKLSVEMARGTGAQQRVDSRMSIGAVLSSILRLGLVDDKAANLVEQDNPSSSDPSSPEALEEPQMRSFSNTHDEIIGDIIDELNQSTKALSGDALSAEKVVGALGRNQDGMSSWQKNGFCSSCCSDCSKWWKIDNYFKFDDGDASAPTGRNQGNTAESPV